MKKLDEFTLFAILKEIQAESLNAQELYSMILNKEVLDFELLRDIEQFANYNHVYSNIEKMIINKLHKLNEDKEKKVYFADSSLSPQFRDYINQNDIALLNKENKK